MRPIAFAILIFIGLNLFLSGLTYVPSISLLLNRALGNKLPQKLILLEEQNTSFNTLALGTSVTHNSFVPKVFDEEFKNNSHSFNMGIPASNPHVLQRFLQYYLQRYPKPKLVLIEVTDTILSLDNTYLPVIEHLNLVTELNDYTALLTGNLDTNEKQTAALFSICSVCQYKGVLSPFTITNKILDLFGEAKPLKLSPLIMRHKLTQTGWQPVTKKMTTPPQKEQAVKLVLNRHFNHLKAVDLHQLTNLLNFCKEKQLNVVLVQWPRLPEYMEKIESTPLYQTYLSELQNMAKHYGYPLINMEDMWKNPKLETKNLYFESTYHLEKQTAIFYTTMLAKQLAQKHNREISRLCHTRTIATK